MTHRDSLGVVQVIRPGEVNWMTAGRGISHSERFDGMRERGGSVHGLQAWVALPEAHEEDDPSFEHYGREDLQQFDLPGVTVRLIAGTLLGRTSGVRTRSSLVLRAPGDGARSHVRAACRIHGDARSTSFQDRST